MKALALVFQFSDKYQNDIVIPGAFHTEMNYIRVLKNHKSWRFVYAEILLEAGLAEKDCLKNILSRKAFAKAMFNLKVTVEALDLLLIVVFVEQRNTEIHPQALVDVIQACNRNNLDAAYKDNSTNLLIRKYVGFQEQVCKGHLKKTVKFWI